MSDIGTKNSELLNKIKQDINTIKENYTKFKTNDNTPIKSEANIQENQVYSQIKEDIEQIKKNYFSFLEEQRKLEEEAKIRELKRIEREKIEREELERLERERIEKERKLKEKADRLEKEQVSLALATSVIINEEERKRKIKEAEEEAERQRLQAAEEEKEKQRLQAAEEEKAKQRQRQIQMFKDKFDQLHANYEELITSLEKNLTAIDEQNDKDKEVDDFKIKVTSNTNQHSIQENVFDTQITSNDFETNAIEETLQNLEQILKDAGDLNDESNKLIEYLKTKHEKTRIALALSLIISNEEKRRKAEEEKKRRIEKKKQEKAAQDQIARLNKEQAEKELEKRRKEREQTQIAIAITNSIHLQEKIKKLQDELKKIFDERKNKISEFKKSDDEVKSLLYEFEPLYTLFRDHVNDNNQVLGDRILEDELPKNLEDEDLTMPTSIEDLDKKITNFKGDIEYIDKSKNEIDALIVKLGDLINLLRLIKNKKQQEERERMRKEKEEQERMRKEKEEQERMRKEEEEQERMRKEEEEQERMRKKEEEQERMRKEKEEEDAKRKQQEEKEKEIVSIGIPIAANQKIKQDTLKVDIPLSNINDEQIQTSVATAIALALSQKQLTLPSSQSQDPPQPGPDSEISEDEKNKLIASVTAILSLLIKLRGNKKTKRGLPTTDTIPVDDKPGLFDDSRFKAKLDYKYGIKDHLHDLCRKKFFDQFKETGDEIKNGPRKKPIYTSHDDDYCYGMIVNEEYNPETKRYFEKSIENVKCPFDRKYVVGTDVKDYKIQECSLKDTITESKKQTPETNKDAESSSKVADGELSKKEEEKPKKDVKSSKKNEKPKKDIKTPEKDDKLDKNKKSKDNTKKVTFADEQVLNSVALALAQNVGKK